MQQMRGSPTLCCSYRLPTPHLLCNKLAFLQPSSPKGGASRLQRIVLCVVLNLAIAKILAATPWLHPLLQSRVNAHTMAVPTELLAQHVALDGSVAPSAPAVVAVLCGAQDGHYDGVDSVFSLEAPPLDDIRNTGTVEVDTELFRHLAAAVSVKRRTTSSSVRSIQWRWRSDPSAADLALAPRDSIVPAAVLVVFNACKPGALRLADTALRHALDTLADVVPTPPVILVAVVPQEGGRVVTIPKALHVAAQRGARYFELSPECGDGDFPSYLLNIVSQCVLHCCLRFVSRCAV